MGNLHFDDDENWSEDSRTGTNFFYIAIHELGHVLGLSHAPFRGNIMNSFINQTLRNEDIDLGPWDKSELRKRYGWRPDCLREWRRNRRAAVLTAVMLIIRNNKNNHTINNNNTIRNIAR